MYLYIVIVYNCPAAVIQWKFLVQRNVFTVFYCAFWKKVVVIFNCKFLYVPSSVFQPVRLAFSSQLKEMNPVCSVLSTVVPPVKVPLIAFAATDTIAPTQTLSRCHAQVCIVLKLLYVNLNLHSKQTHIVQINEYVPTKSFNSNMNSLTHTHFTPASRRALGSKDSGSLCNSKQRNPVRAVPHTNTTLTCP